MTSPPRLRVYADPDHYASANRIALTDILKAQWNTAPLDERRRAHGKRIELFEVVSSPDAADIHLLTMKWPYYVDGGLVDLARRAVDVARRARKPIAVFSESDSEANFPLAGADIHVFEAAGYRSRTRTSMHGMPAFVDDPLALYCGGEIRIRARGPTAVVGFCGQAGASLAHHGARAVRARLRQLRWRIGAERWEPPPLEHTWFRRRVLERFASSNDVTAAFVLRSQYRAGLSSEAERKDANARSRREFIENVVDTDYTICIRGGGNFSVRMYEALALGRAPVFIDSDCLLPYHDRIAWRDYMIWVDARDVADAPRIVAEHHARLTDAELRDRQLACRALWVDRLSPDGFYTHFHEHFPELR